MRLTDAGLLVQASVALAIAFLAAPVVRTVTSEINDTVGRAWPFALARCSAPATPGCRDAAAPSVAGRLATHIRTGRL